MKNTKAFFLTIGILAGIIFVFASFTSTNQISAATDLLSQDKTVKLTPQEMTGVYEFDRAHSSIGFRIKHMGLAEVPGSFTDYSGVIKYDGADVTKSSVEFTAKVASVNTGIEARDKHLRTADFFEVEKYPEMTFKSTKIEKKGENSFVAVGDFTLKGVTKQIALPFTVNGFLKDERGGIKMGASALTIINRQDYGLTWGKVLDNGVLSLDNNVSVNLQIEAAKQQPKPETTK